MVKYHTVHRKNDTKCRGKFFNDGMRGVQFCEPFPPANQRRSNECTASKADDDDDDVLVFFELDRTYNGLSFREYPCTLRPFHPKNLLDKESNRHPGASYLSRRPRNAIVAISVENIHS